MITCLGSWFRSAPSPPQFRPPPAPPRPAPPRPAHLCASPTCTSWKEWFQVSWCAPQRLMTTLERATALRMASSLPKSKSPSGTTMPRSPMVFRCCAAPRASTHEGLRGPARPPRPRVPPSAESSAQARSLAHRPGGQQQVRLARPAPNRAPGLKCRLAGVPPHHSRPGPCPTSPGPPPTCMSTSSQRYGSTSWLPILPSACATYRPRKPVHPKMVTVTPLTCAAGARRQGRPAVGPPAACRCCTSPCCCSLQQPATGCDGLPSCCSPRTAPATR